MNESRTLPELKPEDFDVYDGQVIEAKRRFNGVWANDMKPVAHVKRTINQKIGRFVLRSAATLPLNDVYADPATSYDICDIYGKTCF